jgi:pyruvate/2-oxoglutarate dehydrogenase complex dihydrolipoamide acyltransferase (E2) component
VEIEAPASGVLRDVTANEGDVVPVGQTIAVIKEEVVAILMTQAPVPSRFYYRQLFRQMVQQAIVD